MVSGDRAIQASSLFTHCTHMMIVQCWNQVHKITEEFSCVDELEGLVAAQGDMIDSLANRVRVLEGRVNRSHVSRSSCLSHSSRHSSGGSLYGTPGESIHQPVAVPERLEGFMGDGSKE